VTTTLPDHDEYSDTVEVSRLRASIAEGKTILLGKVAGDKRAAIERCVKENEVKLAEVCGPSVSRKSGRGSVSAEGEPRTLPDAKEQRRG